jgi:5-methylcytosine-specific restriction endonuclease McrA
VTDHPNRIDAHAIRQRARADGIDARTLNAIHVVPAERPDDPGQRVALVVTPDARVGWRLWLLCPRCGSRRVHLYPVRAGVLCRACAGVRYGEQ